MSGPGFLSPSDDVVREFFRHWFDLHPRACVIVMSNPKWCLLTDLDQILSKDQTEPEAARKRCLFICFLRGKWVWICRIIVKLLLWGITSQIPPWAVAEVNDYYTMGLNQDLFTMDLEQDLFTIGLDQESW